MNYYHVNNVKDINFKNILNDYRQCFSGRIAKLTTNYKLLNDFKVLFSDSDLPHLMGWQNAFNLLSASVILRFRTDIDQRQS